MSERSSWLVAAETFVSGVLVILPFFEADLEPDGVVLDASVPETFAACLAAFSASRFCLDAEGGMVVVNR